MKGRSVATALRSVGFSVVWLLAAPTSVYAQPATGNDIARGEHLFEVAYEAYTQGNFRDAAELFERAAGYFPHCPTSMVLRGKSLEQIGRLGEAYEAYLGVNPKAPGAEEAPPCAEARREAEAKVATLSKRVGWLDLRVEVSETSTSGTGTEPANRTAPTGSHIWLTLPNAPGPAANRERYVRPLPAQLPTAADGKQPRVWRQLPMTPGPVVIALDADGAQAQTLVITAGATATVTFLAPNAVTANSVPTQPDVASDPRSSGGAPYGEPWMWAGGVGVVGLVLGTVTGVVASNDTDDVKAHCDSAAQLCTRRGLDARDSAATMGWVSNVSFGVGLAGVIAAGVLYLYGDNDVASGAPAGRVNLQPGVASNAGADGATLSVTW